MKSSFVADLSLGDAVDDVFALRKLELREFSGGKMIFLELGDKSGRIKGVMWSCADELLKRMIPGRVFRFKGTVTSYKGETQVTVEKVTPEEKFDPTDFLPIGTYTIEQLGARLNTAIELINDPDYSAIVKCVFSNDKLKQGFLTGVGGKLWHHNYIGGLAEHTLSIFDLCADFAGRYTELDKNLMLSGALLHDIGKVDSYWLGSFIEYSDKGRLLGHIVMGDEIVRHAVDCLPDFPEEKALKLRHLILSHQGTLDQASPVVPMVPEAMALYVADLLDSKLGALRRIKKNELRPGVRWSNYVKLLDQFIYFGDDGEPVDEEDI